MCVGSNFAMQEMKAIVAAVYSNFRTSALDDGGVEQGDGYTGELVYLSFFLVCVEEDELIFGALAGPKGGKVVLGFERVRGVACWEG